MPNNATWGIAPQEIVIIISIIYKDTSGSQIYHWGERLFTKNEQLYLTKSIIKNECKLKEQFYTTIIRPEEGKLKC